MNSISPEFCDHIRVDSYTKIQSSEEVKEMKKGFKKGMVELRWKEVWTSDEDTIQLWVEYTFPTMNKASKFLGDLLMGIRNHSDLDVDEHYEEMGIIDLEGSLVKICKERETDHNDYTLKELEGSPIFWMLKEDQFLGGRSI